VKTIDLTKERIGLMDLLRLARQEPLLLLTEDGNEFVLSEADDFEHEVATLRASHPFQQLLDARSQAQKSVSLDELEREIDQELSK
jgi:hypothetical protein